MNRRFGIYKNQMVINERQHITVPLIVIKEGRTIVAWTDFHKYININKYKKVRSIASNNLAKMNIICKFLNFVVFDKYHVDNLSEVTVAMVKDFLNSYGLCKLPDDVSEDGDLGRIPTHRSKETVERAVTWVIDFIDAYLSENKGCKLKKKQLYKTVEVFSYKKKRLVSYKKPAFDVNYLEKPYETIRNLPDKVFNILFKQIIEKHINILMLFALGAFAGLRPSEACNVRRADSVLGPGIRFEVIDGEIYNVFIDLTQELNLRSDYISVGKIKKERISRVHPNFLKVFGDCYNLYMNYIEGKRYEVEYGPLTTNRSGKAMTYESYYNEFKIMVRECIPIMLNNVDPEVRNYALLLQEHNISPHILRHWFSVRLVLFGEDVAGLQYYRGDDSPISSIAYINNKSELDKQFRAVANEIFNFNMWRADKEMNEEFSDD